MEPQKLYEIIFYVSVYGLAFLSGCTRLLLSSTSLTCRNVLGIGLNSGFLGFAVVALLVGSDNGFTGSEFYYRAVAVVIGLAGKEQEKILSILWRGLLGKFGLNEVDQCKIDEPDK